MKNFLYVATYVATDQGSFTPPKFGKCLQATHHFLISLQVITSNELRTIILLNFSVSYVCYTYVSKARYEIIKRISSK